MTEIEQFVREFFISAQVGFAFFLIIFAIFWRFFVRIDRN